MFARSGRVGARKVYSFLKTRVFAVIRTLRVAETCADRVMRIRQSVCRKRYGEAGRVHAPSIAVEGPNPWDDSTVSRCVSCVPYDGGVQSAAAGTRLMRQGTAGHFQVTRATRTAFPFAARRPYPGDVSNVIDPDHEQRSAHGLGQCHGTAHNPYAAAGHVPTRAAPASLQATDRCRRAAGVRASAAKTFWARGILPQRRRPVGRVSQTY